MKQRSRIYYSAEQKELMWDRWQAGDSLHEIARLFDRGHSSVQGVLSETGGIRVKGDILLFLCGYSMLRLRFRCASEK